MTTPKDDNAKVAVIVLTLNQRDKTLRCLSRLRAVKHSNVNIVLWDNGSHDGTAEVIRKRFPETLVHYHPVNLGVASGRNAAADLAIKTLEPQYLLFLDNDMNVMSGFVETLLDAFQWDKRIGQTQAKLRFFHDRGRLNDGGGCRIQFWLGRTVPVGYGEIDRGQYDVPRRCVACGGAMMVKTEVFQKLGGFDSRYDPFGPEDLDFSLRLYEAGYYALYVPQAVAFHEVSHTFEGGVYSENYAHHKASHWFYFMWRHASAMEKIGFILIGAPYRIIRVIIREGKRGNIGALKGLLRGGLESCRAIRRSKV